MVTGKNSPRSLSTTHCPECGSTNLIEDYSMGEVACGACGLVTREGTMNTGAEWRAFTQVQKAERSRVGSPTSLTIHDKGLSTVIDRVNRDAVGRKLPAATRFQMIRLRNWHIRARVQTSVDRNLAQAMTEMNLLTDKLRIPKVVKEQGALIYRKALEKGLVQGRSILAIVGASLYAACRFTQTPRTLKEVAGAGLVKKKDVARCYRMLLKELEIKMPIVNPQRYVAKIGSKIGIPEKTQQTAMSLLRKAEEKKEITGKDPMGMAAAALYLACVMDGEKKTQKEIADAASVTEVTVRNRYKGLSKLLKLDV